MPPRTQKPERPRGLECGWEASTEHHARYHGTAPGTMVAPGVYNSADACMPGVGQGVHVDHNVHLRGVAGGGGVALRGPDLAVVEPDEMAVPVRALGEAGVMHVELLELGVGPHHRGVVVVVVCAGARATAGSASE